MGECRDWCKKQLKGPLGFVAEHWRGLVYMALSFVFICLIVDCSSSQIKQSFEDACEKTRQETNKCDSFLVEKISVSYAYSKGDTVRTTVSDAEIKELARAMNYRFTQILADLRLEFSSQLSGLSNWVALWIAMLAIFGTLTPLIMNYLAKGEAKEEMARVMKEVSSVKDDIVKERNELAYIGTNIRLMNIVNSIDALIYENCSTIGSSCPHLILEAYLLSLIESLEKYRKIISEIGPKGTLRMATLLSAVSGIKHIMREVALIFTDGALLPKALARIDDLNDTLNINLIELLKLDRVESNKDTDRMKKLVVDTIVVCINSIIMLRNLLLDDWKRLDTPD